MKALIYLTLLIACVNRCVSQELYPLNEPASNIPRNTFGLRAFNFTYVENGTIRGLNALRLMYGALPRLTVMATVNISNHHGSTLPENLASHTHTGNQTVYYSGKKELGKPYPYRFNGISFYAKYRLISRDGQNKHFRTAVYGTYSLLNVAHDEAEPNLLDDTKGFGGGLINTYLIKKFAVSFTSGIILPNSYSGSIPDPYTNDPIPTVIKYGRAIEYNLSLGYLIFPKEYKSYDQTNWNLYIEFMGKAYEQASITQYADKNIPVTSPHLLAGNYIDFCPGVQAIIRSNLRLDLSIKLPMLNRSYAHTYPVYALGIQYYLYTKGTHK